MENSFLHSIAELYYRQIEELHDGSLSMADILFVFPNRRAGLFFRKEYFGIASHTVFAPNTTDINRLCESISPLKLANDIELLLTLYNAYTEVYAKNESADTANRLDFNDFISQGSIMLSDFDEIDKYLVNQSYLFKNIDDLNSLTIENNIFSNEQIEAIRQFWNNANVSESDSGNLTFKKKFVSFWSLLLPIYTLFKEKLQQKGIGYPGMIYRDVVENILKTTDPMPQYKRVVFVGFNVITPTEEGIMKHFDRQGIADFYFDYPQQYGDNSVFSNTVGKMYDANRHFKSLYLYSQPTEIQCADITIHSTPSATEECEIASQTIHNIYRSAGNSIEKLSASTALLLADESLLTSILDTLPHYIDDLNITMGYTLNQVPIANLVENIIVLQIEARPANNSVSFYHKPLINILTHPYLQSRYHSLASEIVRHITQYNFVRIDQTELHSLINNSRETDSNKQLFIELFSHYSTTTDILGYLTKTLNLLIDNIDADTDTDTNNINENFEIEYLCQYHEYLCQLDAMLREAKIETDTKTLNLLIERLTQRLKVQFKGEPLKGFQIMGMLESRLLDFENIIIVGFNDSLIPGTSIKKSLIPYNLRTAYGLPTYELTDAIYAYNFYRTLYRAKDVHLITNSSNNSTSNNEISRYYYQIKYLLPSLGCNNKLAELRYDIPIPAPTAPTNQPTVNKNSTIMAELNRFDTTNGNRFFSASSLKQYIACPLKFYYGTLANLKDVQQVTEVDNAPLLGNIFHKAMELYYKKNIRQPITDSMIEALAKEAFAELKKERNKGLELSGFNHLIFNVVCRFIKCTLAYDSRREQFTILQTEENITGSFNNAAIKAIIDRTDITDTTGVINIIDYKTTHATESKYTFNLLNLINSTKSTDHEIFQILLYCHIYHQQHNIPAEKIRPNIYNIFELYKIKENSSTNFENKILTIKVPTLLLSDTGPDTIDFEKLQELNPKEFAEIEVYSYADIKRPFEYVLKHLFDEIYNPEIPFTSNPTDTANNNCTYCPYTRLCGITPKKN